MLRRLKGKDQMKGQPWTSMFGFGRDDNNVASENNIPMNVSTDIRWII